jgi:PAS domain-containing protein
VGVCEGDGTQMEQVTWSTNPGGTFDRTIFDAIPIPVFVVDDDVRVLDLNGAAAQFCSQEREQIYRRRGGEILHCLRSLDVPEGCGRGPACKTCVIRNSVKRSLIGQTVSRKRMVMFVAQELGIREMQVLVTACPMPQGHEARAVLMMEDITSISTLKSLIPICMTCKSVRQDEEYWETLETYVHEHMGVDFSHGICPKCVDQFYPELRK